MGSETQVRYEKASVAMDDGRKMSLVYGIPQDHANNGTCMIIAHGAGGPMYSPFISYFHSELARNGLLTVKFNFPYMEAKRKLPDRPEVLKASYARIINEARSSPHHPRKMIIGGKSMGGRIASMVAADGVDVDGLFFLGYPLHAPGKFGELRDEHLYRIEKPMLFVSGTRDTFARRDLMEKVLAKLGNNFRVQWIEDGDHSFKKSGGREELAKTYREVLTTLTEWAGSFRQAT